MARPNSIPRVQELRREKKTRLYKKLALIFLGLLVLFIGLSFLSKERHIIIKDVVVSGTVVLEPEDIKSVVQKNITGNYIYLFSRKNIFLYPHDKIEKNLRDTFKRISSLSVEIDKEKNLKISLTERSASYLWCGEHFVPTLERSIENSKCFFIDSNGYIFAPAPYFSGNVYFTFYGKLSLGDSAVPLGSIFLPQEDFIKLVSFRESLASLGVETDSFLIDEEGEYNFFIRTPNLKTSPKIIFEKNFDGLSLATDLGSALRAEPLVTSFKQKLSTLEYLDLRHKNKILYKFTSTPK